MSRTVKGSRTAPHILHQHIQSTKGTPNMESITSKPWPAEGYSDHDLLLRTVTLLEVVTIDLRTLRTDHERPLRTLERWTFMGIGGQTVLDFLGQMVLKLH